MSTACFSVVWICNYKYEGPVRDLTQPPAGDGLDDLQQIVMYL